MRPERQMDEDELQRDVVRTAADLLGYTAGCFYKNHPRRSEVEVAAVHLLPQHIVGRCEAYSRPTDRCGRGRARGGKRQSARLRASDESSRLRSSRLPVSHGDRRSLAASRRRSGSGAGRRRRGGAPAVYRGGSRRLERFAAHATSVFHASRLWNWDVAAFEQRAALRKISDSMLGASDQTKVLASLLTGATASYGLQFNRAAVLLFDSQFRRLEGRLGIGYMSEPETRTTPDASGAFDGPWGPRARRSRVHAA